MKICFPFPIKCKINLVKAFNRGSLSSSEFVRYSDIKMYRNIGVGDRNSAR